ncbi:MAG: ATP-dependent DNA helicase [Nitrospirae bacterium]|nr:ATP-dependent DNA helicase [Nitrospirota bacterium]
MKPDLSQNSLDFLTASVAKAKEDYEIRPSQLSMMGACSEIIEQGGIVMAEAGTGTGKTFAYLIPAILSGKKAIISTRTINLQEQLISKDLSFLSTLTACDYAIAKGRGNYLCLRRLNAFRPADEEESYEHRAVMEWAGKTETGDREDQGTRRSLIWERVLSDADACRGKRCMHFDKCFYFRARRRCEKAQIVVANHAITAINAMLSEDAAILPEAEVLILDEAHALDHSLSDQIGLSLSRRAFENIINRLLRLGDRGTYKGLLANSPNLFPVVEALRNEMDIFWNRVRMEARHREMLRGTFLPGDMMTACAASVRALIEEIRATAAGLFEEDDETELKACMIKLRGFGEGMDIFPEGVEGFVRWAEIEEGRTGLRMAPVYPKDFIRDHIITKYPSIILTSATLSVAGDFSFTEKVLGLEGAEKLALASPFDLKKQVSIEIRKGISLQDLRGGVEALSRVIVDEATRRDGGVLVLFTSRDVMKRTWDLSWQDIHDAGLNPMLQGEMPSRMMLDTMRKGQDSVIFGLDSFWEGVDVKGDSLKCLIISKLPFEVPTEPIVLARTEEIEKRGGRPFYEYSLPRAALKFKQGCGRLIRSKTDTGRIIVCDERIKTKSYGRVFLEGLF